MSKNLKLKVCGMKTQKNIFDLLKLNPDFIGFIFYDKSKRYIVKENLQEYISNINYVKKVGVFVNETTINIEKYRQEYKLDYIQLHGNETPEFCNFFYNKNVKIIKAFHINEGFDFAVCDAYKNVCDYFLFDTKSEQYGGTGNQFNWNLLKNYKDTKPYFLSGGISLNDAKKINELSDDRIHAIDINSNFEANNGLKKINEINEFIKIIN
jgi:phosphoribosylanthranilate isomerase